MSAPQPPTAPPASPPPQPPGGIDWVKVVAGALAAISSAVLLSTLGAAGTIIGAALGSVIVSVTSSIYSSGLARSRAQLAEAQEAALRKVGLAQAEVRRAKRRADDEELPAAEAHLQYADRQLADARVELSAAEPTEPVTPGWRERLAVLPWKRIALLAVGFFVAAAVLITAFELIAGRPISSYTGGSSNEHGTSLSHLGGGGSGNSSKPKPTPTPSTSPTPSSTATPSTTPSTSPSASPTSTPTPSVVPSAEPSPTPSATPTSSPSGVPSLLP